MKILKTFYRIYLRKSDLAECKKFYMTFQGLEQVHHEFYYEAFRLEIVAIGTFLLIAGDEADAKRFEPTKLTCLVDDLDAVRAYFTQIGVKIIDDIKMVPSGRNLRATNPDGLTVEYVQHSNEFIQRMSENAYNWSSGGGTKCTAVCVQPGQRITLSSLGLPSVRGIGKGDLHVDPNVVVPKKLNKEQKETLQKYAEISSEEADSHADFFGKMFSAEN